MAAVVACPDLWFVCCVANPMGYKSRIALYDRFVDHVLHDLRVNLCVVECAYGGSAHVCDRTAGDAAPEFMHVPVRAESVLWHKENLLNIGMRALPIETKYVCWCDADITFENKSVATDIVAALKRHAVVQCFERCADLGPDGETMRVHRGYAYSSRLGLPQGDSYSQWHSGYVWAARADFLAAVGYLFETAVIGSADRQMADVFHGHPTPNGTPQLALWSRLARRCGPVGYVSGTIRHGFHGHKKDRSYKTRGAILVDAGFDPDVDLRRNADGVFEWTDPDGKLARDVRAYFVSRNEDATDRRGHGGSGVLRTLHAIGAMATRFLSAFGWRGVFSAAARSA